MIIDSHCHLQDYGARVGEIWKRAMDAGVRRCITVGTSLKDCFAARKVARSLEGVAFAGGLHPVDAERFSEEWDEIRRLCCSDECIAVGETGLDFFKGPVQLAQVKSLEEQLELAASLGKPVILHVRPRGRDISAIRNVHDVLFSTLRQHRNVRCVFHCFAGSVREAREAVTMGHYLSFAGTLTYGNETGRMLVEAAKFVPAEQVMVETDAPYLRPDGCPSKRNEPVYVKLTLAKLAQVRGWTMADAVYHTTKNAKDIFGL